MLGSRAVRIETAGDERMLVFPMREDQVVVAVDDPRFGRISTVCLDAEQAADLAAALREAVAQSA